MSSNYLTPSNPKTILHSKRINIYYLEKCRVQVNGGRVEYVTSEDKESYYWNIPVANTTALMLGVRTSVTQAAMREFAHAGVMVGFCGTDGTPLYSANEVNVDISWLSPQSEYRPTEYLQQWIPFWFVEVKRLAAAKRFQLTHLAHIEEHWTSVKVQHKRAFQPDVSALHAFLNRTREEIDVAENYTQLMLIEAKLTKALYKVVSQTVGYGDFTHVKRGGGIDMANCFLDQENYLVYGLAAVTARITGIPRGLAVMHGKTRRSGFVFDPTDLIKDALVMPQAFIAAMAGGDAQKFRQRCINIFQQADALDVMITSLQGTAQALAKACLLYTPPSLRDLE